LACGRGFERIIVIVRDPPQQQGSTLFFLYGEGLLFSLSPGENNCEEQCRDWASEFWLSVSQGATLGDFLLELACDQPQRKTP